MVAREYRRFASAFNKWAASRTTGEKQDFFSCLESGKSWSGRIRNHVHRKVNAIADCQRP
jgi:hypothetical protein